MTAYMPKEAVPWKELLDELGMPAVQDRGKRLNAVARVLHSNGLPADMSLLDSKGHPTTWIGFKRIKPDELAWLMQMCSQVRASTSIASRAVESVATERIRSRSRSPPAADDSLMPLTKRVPTPVVASAAPCTALALREAVALDDSAPVADDPVAWALVRSGTCEKVATEASRACRACGLVKLMQFRMAEQEDLAGVQCSSEARLAIAKLPGLAANQSASVDGVEQLHDVQGEAVAAVVHRIDGWQPDGLVGSSCRMARGPMQNLSQFRQLMDTSEKRAAWLHDAMVQALVGSIAGSRARMKSGSLCPCPSCDVRLCIILFRPTVLGPLL